MKKLIWISFLFSLNINLAFAQITNCEFDTSISAVYNIDSTIEAFYEVYSNQFADKPYKHRAVSPFLKEVMNRVGIDFTNQTNEILYNIVCGRSIGIDINTGGDSHNEEYLISILDLDGGNVELTRRTSSLNIPIGYLNSDSYMIVASKLNQVGLDFLQNDKFSIIVADLDPINGGGNGQNGNPSDNGGLTIYPNPFDGRIQINNGQNTFEDFSDIEILSIDGKLVQRMAINIQTKMNNKINYDFGYLRPGLYILKLIGQDQHLAFKLLKE